MYRRDRSRMVIIVQSARQQDPHPRRRAHPRRTRRRPLSATRSGRSPRRAETAFALRGTGPGTAGAAGGIGTAPIGHAFAPEGSCPARPRPPKAAGTARGRNGHSRPETRNSAPPRSHRRVRAERSLDRCLTEAVQTRRTPPFRSRLWGRRAGLHLALASHSMGDRGGLVLAGRPRGSPQASCFTCCGGLSEPPGPDLDSGRGVAAHGRDGRGGPGRVGNGRIPVPPVSGRLRRDRRGSGGFGGPPEGSHGIRCTAMRVLCARPAASAPGLEVPGRCLSRKAPQGSGRAGAGSALVVLFRSCRDTHRCSGRSISPVSAGPAASPSTVRRTPSMPRSRPAPRNPRPGPADGRATRSCR